MHNMSRTTVETLEAFEILDSRGRPTLEVHAVLGNGRRAMAQVPSGASTGQSEAHELRDGEVGRYRGLGVRQACRNVEGELAEAIAGIAVDNQERIDAALIGCDGTSNKSRLGANAILGVSCAVARAAAQEAGVPLYEWLAQDRRRGGMRRGTIPMPMVNILSGGLHASRAMEFQDFLAMPIAAESFAEAMEWICRIHAAAREVLEARGAFFTGVADEGGWGPRLGSNEEALEVMVAAIERAGLKPGEQVAIALDVAASHFFSKGFYELEGQRLGAKDFIGKLEGLARKYPILSIEDGLEQNDWAHWPELTAKLGGFGKRKKLQIVGDDFLTTKMERLEMAIEAGAANAVLVKMNQIGTLTETFAVIDRAREAGFGAVISARSGETEDSFLADLAIASGMGQIKVGSITRSERLAKYNRLLVLEKSTALPYAGAEGLLI
jgi:enolase